jgi:glutamate-1-semialdehyde 2,1-aminomutase
MTGFRLAPGGAQERFGIKPDLTTLGKIIGGGLPVGAFGGRADIMDLLAPLGPVYQAGTLSGNPLAMAVGIAALELLSEGRAPRVPEKKSEMNAYARLEELGRQLEAGMKDTAKSAGVPVTFNRCGSMFCAYFTSEPVHNLADAIKSDRRQFAKFFHGMLAEGIYLAPSQFEADFISTAHTATDIEQTIKAATKVLRGL